ncbi:MAG TPA: hypothetical protein VL486_01900 [Verrucomicrobiae bacterium]|nr:hypothetical protein [Verrucomicrobiae bacterium]
MLEPLFSQLSPIEWDAERGDLDCDRNTTAVSRRLDFHIRLEADEYYIDVFDSSIESTDEAYLTSHHCETWEQVERFCRDYDGMRVI